jgi:beta-lactamase class A
MRDNLIANQIEAKMLSAQDKIVTQISSLIRDSGLEAGFAAIAVESGRVLAIEGDTLFPTASTFKVPVMVEVYAQARVGRFGLADRIPFNERFRVIGSGVLQTLSAGLQPTVRDLMMLMTIVSDNTATDILCDLVGLNSVTARMRTLGIADIHTPDDCHNLLARAWDVSTASRTPYAAFKATSKARPMAFSSAAYARSRDNNVATALAMARLMVLIAKGEAGHPDDCADMIAVLENQHYVDRVPRYLPQGSTANKTGSLRGLRNDIGLIRRSDTDRIAYAMFTLDTTEHPHGNSRALVEANTRIGSLMGEVGQILWDEFARV